MRTKLRGKVTLLFIVSALLLAIPAVAALAQDTGASPAPTIESDKDDYAPGELVTLTGGGWQPGELVHINVNDAQGQTWSRDVDVTANASGNIADSFTLPNSFVPDYDVTATGAQSGTATTTFTDSQPLSVSVSPTSGTVNQNAVSSAYFINVVMGGNLAENCAVTLSVAKQAEDTGLPSGPSGALPSIGTPNGNNPYTTNSTFTAVLLIATRFDTPPGTYTFHVKASGGAGCEGNGDVFSQQLTLVVNPVVRPTSTTVTSSSNPSTYGNDVTFTATVNSGAGSPTAGQGTVTFKDGPNAITGCSNAALDSNSKATCTTSALNVAGSPHSITAEYSGTSSGSPQFQASTSLALSQTVNKAATTTTVTCGAGPFIFNGSAHTLCSAKVTGPGGLNLTPDVVYANNVNAGTATASYTYDETANYLDSSDSETFTIDKADATINVNGYTGVYDGNAHGATGTAKGVNDESLDSLLHLGDSFTNVPGGTANWTFAGNGNYKSANGTAQIVINKEELLVNAKDQSTVYGDENLPPTYELSGFENNEDKDSAGITGAPECSISDSAGPNVGEYSDAIVCAPGTLSADNYSFAAGSKGKLTITKRPITVTADNQSKKLGDPNPTFTASYTGFVNGEDKSVLDGTLTFTTNVPSPEQAGTWDITPSGLTSSNYSITFVKGTLTITSITYKFDGFRSPVDNPGTGATPVFNSAKAGQSIPVKFGLGGNQGLNIIAAGFPKVTSVNCVSSATVAPIEEYAASTANGGLTYEATADQYNYIWKTQSTYVNKCYKFDLQLTDGTSHVAYFKFLK